MTTRGSQTITWDVENRPITITEETNATYAYDGAAARHTMER